MSSPRITHYDWPGGREAMLRFGPERGPALIAALPLFEEANRTRASMIAVLRRLAECGIASALPDLPGTGESLVPTSEATLAHWRTAFAAAVRTLPGPVHAVSWRGGVLVDADAEVASRWHLSPLSGADTMRELRRVQATAGGELFAGNRLSDVLVSELESATLPSPVRPELVEGLSFLDPVGEKKGSASTSSARTGLGIPPPLRTIRLATDPRPADAHLPGRPLWRAAEPGTDPALEAALADDIAAWIIACAA